MKSAEEFAKQIDAMSITHDAHWQNYVKLIEARDAEHARSMKYTLEDLQNDKPIPESLTDEAYRLMNEDGIHKDDMPDFLPDYVMKILDKRPWQVKPVKPDGEWSDKSPIVSGWYWTRTPRSHNSYQCVRVFPGDGCLWAHVSFPEGHEELVLENREHVGDDHTDCRRRWSHILEWWTEPVVTPFDDLILRELEERPTVAEEGVVTAVIDSGSRIFTESPSFEVGDKVRIVKL